MQLIHSSIYNISATVIQTCIITIYTWLNKYLRSSVTSQNLQWVYTLDIKSVMVTTVPLVLCCSKSDASIFHNGHMKSVTYVNTSYNNVPQKSSNLQLQLYYVYYIMTSSCVHTHLEYSGCVRLLSLAPQWMHLSLMSAIVYMYSYT